MVYTRPLISNSSSSFINPLVTVPSAPITTSCLHQLHFMFQRFFSFLRRSRYLSFFFAFFQFFSVVCWDGKVHNLAGSLYLWTILRSDRLAEFRWFMCMSKSHRSLCVSYSRTGASLCIYHLFVWSNLNFLHISEWIILPNQSCLALYSCANLLHSLIMWLIIWSSVTT